MWYNNMIILNILCVALIPFSTLIITIDFMHIKHDLYLSISEKIIFILAIFTFIWGCYCGISGF